MDGMIKAELPTLPRIGDRMTFLYLEKCKINRRDSALAVFDIQRKGMVYIPVASISVLLLGPGVDITHDAMTIACDAGITIEWIGEQGVRFYASGRCLTHSSALLLQQAKLVTNQRTHLEVAKKMYSMRFSDDISSMTMQQLRGIEGSRVKALYKKYADQYGIKFNRDYDKDNFNAGDPVNQALTVGNYCLYGLAHSVICALGLSPALGFVHVGHDLSFVYDVADLYKHQTSIPMAFEVGSSNTDDIEGTMRRKMRDAFKENRLLPRMVKDLFELLEFKSEDVTSDADIVYIWDYSTKKTVGFNA